ncbi:hypothetical protein L249_0173, partial [Ophiocordyceps polyrhachis-furcata BCC 54312]
CFREAPDLFLTIEGHRRQAIKEGRCYTCGIRQTSAIEASPLLKPLPPLLLTPLPPPPPPPLTPLPPFPLPLSTSMPLLAEWLAAKKALVDIPPAARLAVPTPLPPSRRPVYRLTPSWQPATPPISTGVIEAAAIGPYRQALLTTIAAALVPLASFKAAAAASASEATAASGAAEEEETAEGL